MKKSIIVFLLTISVFLVGCQNGTDSKNVNAFMEKAEALLTKITELSEEEKTTDEMAYHQLFTSESPANFTKEDFMEGYNSQPGMSVYINREDYLDVYRDLLNQIIVELGNVNVIKLDAFMHIDFEELGNVDIYCGFANDDEILFKLNYTLEENRVFSAFKLGYDNEQFFVKKMDYSHIADDINYSYSEFYENRSYFALSFDTETSYSYHYISKENLDEIDVVRSVGAIEAETPETGYNIQWLNVAENQRYLYSITEDKIILSEYIDFFNDHSIVFSYMDNDTRNDDLRIIWNLLEVEGWDFVSFVNDNEYSQDDALYKNDIRLFPEDLIRAYINPSNVLLSLEKNVSRDNLTDAILNLSEYGLDFNFDGFNLTFLDVVRNSAIETVNNFAVFSNLNIFDDSFTDSFIDMIDPDLSYEEVEG